MRDATGSTHDSGPPTLISLPFEGRWLARNSPARRVPSHGSDLLGERYAIDFIAVDERRRTDVRRDWRTLLSSEPADRFVAFGQPILAPADGVVVTTHDGEPDHEARRSLPAAVPYLLGQAARLREGLAAIAGNHVIIALPDRRAFVALVHLRSGSLLVPPGETVSTGQQLAQCGNSGNSTQPHVHVQVMDSADLSLARGLPMAFADYREWTARGAQPQVRSSGMPGEGAVVEPLPARP
jgi:hypothetical protein